MGTHKTQTVVGLRLLTTELWKTKIKTNTHVQHLPISTMLGQIEGRKRRGRQGMRQMDGLTDSMTCLSKLQEMAKDREAWHAAVYAVTKNQTWLSDWTTTVMSICPPCSISSYACDIVRRVGKSHAVGQGAGSHTPVDVKELVETHAMSGSQDMCPIHLVIWWLSPVNKSLVNAACDALEKGRNGNSVGRELSWGLDGKRRVTRLSHSQFLPHQLLLLLPIHPLPLQAIGPSRLWFKMPWVDHNKFPDAEHKIGDVFGIPGRKIYNHSWGP